jgi:hypothetical protein
MERCPEIPLTRSPQGVDRPLPSGKKVGVRGVLRSADLLTTRKYCRTLLDMKTTLDIPDALLRQVKARAALNGTSMRDYIVQTLESRLEAERRQPERLHGWRAVFGKAPKSAAAEVQAVVDEEFETIRPEDWK